VKSETGEKRSYISFAEGKEGEETFQKTRLGEKAAMPEKCYISLGPKERWKRKLLLPSEKKKKGALKERRSADS